MADQILKFRGILLIENYVTVKTVTFQVLTYDCESWTIRKTEQRKTDVSELKY